MSSVPGRSTLVVLSTLVALALGPQALAQETDAPEAAAAPAAESAGVEVGGFVDAYYGYNFNEADPGLRTFDVQHNTISLALAELNLSKAPTAESRLGFRIDLDFGKTAELTTAFEPSESDRVVYQHVQQAYLSLLTGKVQWDAGKFVTPIGAEVIESQDNWNYTRSILFGYAIPFYHLGVRAALPVNDKLTLTGFLTNGWNNASELDGDKTFAISAALTPVENLSLIANYMVGREAPEGVAVRDLRHIFDTTLSVSATEKLSFMANFDYGVESGVKWWGVAAYAKFQALPNWAVVGRYEYIDDTEGGFMTIGTKAQSLTLTSDHLLAGGLKARLEYRLDLTDEDFFTKSDGSPSDKQSTVTLGLVYGFGGKI